jgi:dynein heavy chain
MPNPMLSCPTCNHAAEAIESVPSFKLFCFGGQTGGTVEKKTRGEWHYMNTVDVLDTGTMMWTTPLLTGTPPREREDSDWAYDPKSCKLFMFGGWSDQWLRDLVTLEVAGIVGPPYALTELEPNMGPITGHTPLVIRGLNFVETSQVQVKFTDGKHEETINGKFVSQNEITCTSPVWEKFGAGEVDVRVNLRDQGYTVNKVRWSFYVNTRPQKCLAYGPGLFENGVWGFPSQFIVQAKDSTGRARTSGGDLFQVAVTHAGDSLEVSVADNKDGTYLVTWVPRTPGEYSVSVTLEDTVQGGEVFPIRGSPWVVKLDDPWVVPKLVGVPPKARDDVCLSPLLRKLVVYVGQIPL